ncbi:MAG: protein kinase domain-containing protein, partial [Gemmatimonadales bacterium]
GVVHRDIKPENVLLSGGAAVVTDFGIAKALSASRTQEGGASATLTQAGGTIGTPAYMAPEQAVGDVLDHRADLYAWGLMAYELLTGTHPFSQHTTPQRMIAAQLSEAPTPIGVKHPSVPPVLAALVMQCLAKDPADRPATAGEILRGLDGVFTSDGSRSAAARPGPLHQSRRRVLMGAVGLAVLAIAVVLLTHGRAGLSSTSAAAIGRSVAVLPLANLSGDKEDDYFGIGLAEELTRALSKTGVRVIGRVSASALQAKGLDEHAIAKELGVGSLLTGTVQRADGQIRIQMSLLAAADGAVRWTEKYDRPLANVFAVQDEIARSVAGKLLGSLGGATIAGPTRNETADPEAHALFLQGQVLFNRRTVQSLRQSIALFERAAARDSNYARAWGLMAMSYSVLPAYSAQHTDSARARAVIAAKRALRIDSMIAEAYTALAYVDLARGDNHESDSLFRRSLALDSTVATTWGWYGLLAMHLGDFAEAVRRSARARELEPASSIVQTWEAQAYLAERHYAQADSVADQVLARDSTFALGWVTKANALINLGRATEAIAILERRVAELRSPLPTETQALLAYACARAGRPERAREILADMRKAAGGSLPPIGTVAATLDLLGERDQAVAVLGGAFADHDLWLATFNHTERYDGLRQDPRAAMMFAKSEAW